MVFSSKSFLFLFLPLFLVAYYATPTRLKSYTILAGSYVFYAWWRVDFLGLLFATTAFAYVVGQRVARHRGTRAGRVWLGVGVVGCLGVLGVFKYLNFFIDSFAALLGTDPAGLGVHWHLILPIGISFYVFQALSYLIDVHRKDASADASFIDFAAFIALFPQLIAGPILRYKDLEDQFRAREHSVEKFCDGLARFLIGLAKKVILADAVAPLADLAFGNSGEVGMALAWVGAVAYMLQLYFDFSGYSDMAIGLGKMMGFNFLENFRFPYISRSITEFWRRWHISLSNWLRDYLYISLGGNRKGPRRTYANLMTVMVLGGLWHGANWTFVLWGVWHGGLLAIERATGWDKRAAARVYALPMTLLFVLIGWVVFRAEHVGQAFDIYAAMLGLNGFIGDPALWSQVTRESVALALLAALICGVEPAIERFVIRMSDAPPTPVGAGAGAVAVARPLAQSMFTMAILAVGTLTIFKLAEQSFSLSSISSSEGDDMSMKTPHKLILPVAFFGYAAFANVTLLQRGDWNGLERAGFLKGEMAAQVDNLYREALPHREPAIGIIGAARYALLNEGRDGVVTGKPGWLYTREEFRPLDEAPTPLSETVAYMIEARDALAAQGASLVILPLPAKLDIARDGARMPHEAARIADEYVGFLAAMADAGLTAFDTRPVMEKGAREAFYRTDTHWTVDQAADVAAALAGSAVVPRGETAFEKVEGAPRAFMGDLVSFVTSDLLAPAVGLSAETVTPYTAQMVESGPLDLGLDAAGGLDIFGADAPEGLALVGTSYSANPNWSFAEALKLALGQDVFNHALEGLGPVVPMQQFIASLDRDAPPATVLWEFPVRYLSDPALFGAPLARVEIGTIDTGEASDA